MNTNDELQDLVTDYLERISKGESAEVVVASIRAAHPRYADRFVESIGTLRRSGLEGTATVPAALEQLGEFQLLDRIGGGGMGVVYKAYEASVSRTVALKVIRADLLHMDGARKRFQREAEAVARLAHPSIAALFAFGEENDVPYCAMEYVPGASLDVVLRRLVGHRVESLGGSDMRAAVSREADDSPSAAVDPNLFEGSWAATCLRIARETARALSHAHERGVLHRDVKPSNVMVTGGGRVVLLDFGLARLRTAGALTQTGVPMGSLPYMSPEQAAGRMSQVDERSDVYGLGVMLYELLTLRPPFSGRNLEVVRSAILDGTHVPLRRLNGDLSRDVEVVVARAMDLDPRRRYATAADLARDLTNLLERRPVDARPAGLHVKIDRLVRRHPTASVAAAAALVFSIGGPLVFGVMQAKHAGTLEVALQETDTLLSSALFAVGEVLRPLSATQLADSPGFQDLRVTLFREALTLVEEIASVRPLERRVRLERGRLESELGMALVERLESEEALERLSSAQSILAKLGDEDRTAELRRILAVNQMALAQQLYNNGDAEDARGLLNGAAQAARDLLAESPDDTERLILCARCTSAQMQQQVADGDRTGAARTARVAQDFASRAREIDSTLAVAHAIFARAVVLETQTESSGSGTLLWPNERRAERLEVAQAAFAQAHELAPESRSVVLGLIGVHCGLGGVSESSQRFDQAEASYMTALPLAEDLVARFPEIAAHHMARLRVLGCLAVLMGHTGDEHGSLARHIETAEANLDFARSEELPGPGHLGAAVACSNLAVQVLNMDDLGDERFEIAGRWLDKVQPLLERTPAESFSPRQRSVSIFHAIISAGLESERGDYGAAIENLTEAKLRMGAAVMPVAAGLAEGWAVLVDQMPESHPERETAQETCVVRLVEAIDAGLPAGMLSMSDYFSPFLDEKRVQAASARQAAERGSQPGDQ